MKSFRQRVLKRQKLNTLVDLLRRNTGVNHTNRPFQLVPLPANAFRLAENILLQHAATFDIGPNDALHLAIVKQLPLTPSPILVTSDRSMQHIGGRLGIGIYDPEMEWNSNPGVQSEALLKLFLDTWIRDSWIQEQEDVMKLASHIPKRYNLTDQISFVPQSSCKKMNVW